VAVLVRWEDYPDLQPDPSNPAAPPPRFRQRAFTLFCAQYQKILDAGKNPWKNREGISISDFRELARKLGVNEATLETTLPYIGLEKENALTASWVTKSKPVVIVPFDRLRASFTTAYRRGLLYNGEELILDRALEDLFRRTS